MFVSFRDFGRCVASFVFLSLMGSSLSAQDFFDGERIFVVEKNCQATRSIRKGTEASDLVVGESYVARGVNKVLDPSHVFIRVDGGNKWVSVDCGRFADGNGTIAGASTGDDKTCLPFFDEQDNKVTVGFGGAVDITPQPPRLDVFDQSVMAVCGAPGKVVSRAEFKRLLTSHPGVLKSLRDFTSGKVFGDRPKPDSLDDYLDDLAEAWFSIKAFDHIFCGEPNPGRSGGKVGGLHFHGRYLQLQESGALCRMNNLRQSEVVPGVIYTMGLRMKNKHGRFVPDARKGYGLTLSAKDLLKLVTRAFAENPTERTSSTGCLLEVSDDGNAFRSVFVRRKKGIRTFYPDATPNGRGDFSNPDCVNAISLQ